MPRAEMITHPAKWAGLVAERVKPKTLQAEVALVILWDLLEGEPPKWYEGICLNEFGEFTGDPKGWGPFLDLVHSDDEVEEALRLIDYPTKDRVYMERVIPTTDRMFHGRRKEPGLEPIKLTGVDSWVDQVDKAWRRVWERRMLPLPFVPHKHIIDYDMLNEWALNEVSKELYHD